jgi:drug/metabolite transporter (DMT)-like permease
VLAWVFLDEAPGIGGVAGIVIVSAGALLAQGVKIPMPVSASRTRQTTADDH